jgi:uncharacterized protein (DUF952 family)
MVSSVGLISNRQDQCQLREKFSCPDCDLKKALPISHLSIGIAFRCTPEGGCAEASDGFAYRNDLQIADGLAGCFSHSAKNCFRNEWPQACREAVAVFNAGALSASVPAMISDTVIHHMCRAEEWAAAQLSGSYPGSSQDAADGFIHFSTASQIVESAARHRAGQTGLVLLSVPAERLGTALKWEPSRGGALFPHLYGPLPVDAVTAVDPLPLGPDGRHVFPLAFQGRTE